MENRQPGDIAVLIRSDSGRKLEATWYLESEVHGTSAKSVSNADRLGIIRNFYAEMNRMEWSDDTLAGVEDDAVLMAALEFIETADLPEEEVSHGSNSSLEVRIQLGRFSESPDGSMGSKRRIRGRPRTSSIAAVPQRRNRTKETIEQLRTMVQDLELQLAALQCARLGEKHEPKRTQCEAWKAIAKRQLVQRQRVEREKHNLLEVIALQSATIENLQQLIAGYSSYPRPWISLSLDASSSLARLWSNRPGSANVLDSLTMSLDHMLLHTDAVFGSQAASSMQLKTEQEPTNGTLTVQLLDTRLVPFGLESTAQAVWANLLHRANQTTHDKCLDKNIVQAQFLTVVPGFEGHVEAAMVLRRVVEPHRVVMVRSSVFAYQPSGGIAQGTSTTMSLHHFLWTTVRPVPEDSICSTASQIQTCFVSVPTSRSTTIAQLCADVSKQFNADAHDEVDNLLLEPSHG